MAREMPKAGRPAKTAGGKVPARKPGTLAGSMRQRASVDTPWNPTGTATPMPKPKRGKKS